MTTKTLDNAIYFQFEVAASELDPDNPGRVKLSLRTEDGEIAKPTEILFNAATIDAGMDELDKNRPDETRLMAMGLELAKLFPEKILEHIDKHPDTSVRTTIRLQPGAQDIAIWPWEFVKPHGANKYLAQCGNSTLRYEQAEKRRTPWKPDEPPRETGRILFVYWAGGGNVPADEHFKTIRKIAGDTSPVFGSDDQLSNPRVDDLVKKLRNAVENERPYTILHILAHGTPATGNFGTGLVANAADRVIDGPDLSAPLTEFATTLRLVVLCACYGGYEGRRGNPFGSVARSLNVTGIESVISSRFPLSTAGSTRFAHEFYAALIRDLQSVPEAFLAARNALRNDQSTGGPLDYAALQLWARESAGWETRPVIVRPFRGLRAFDLAHKPFFKGRDDATDKLFKRVNTLLNKPTPHFLVLAGASGVGKTSLLEAGLMPQFSDEPRSSALIRPSDPNRMGALEFYENKHADTGPNAHPFLLVVDQFEEIFALDDSDRSDYIDQLLCLANLPHVVVVGSIRAEFLARLGEEPVVSSMKKRFDEVVLRQEPPELLWSLEQQGLRGLIEYPLWHVGVDIEEQLVLALLGDMNEKDANLPQLEYVLDRLWEKRTFDESKSVYILRLTDYEALGRVGGALANAAENFVAELGENSPQCNMVRMIFERLIEMRGDARSSTRRRLVMSALRTEFSPNDRPLFDEMVPLLEKKGLLALTLAPNASESYVEIVHEQLVRSWARLQKWLEASEVWIRFRTTLQDQADEWDQKGRNEKWLLADAHLAEARKRYDERGRNTSDLSEKAQEFLQRSEQRELDEKNEKERKNRHIRALMILNGVRACLRERQRVYAARLLMDVEPQERSADWVSLACEVLCGILPSHTFEGIDAHFAYAHDKTLIVTRDAAQGKVFLCSPGDNTIWDTPYIDGFFAASIAVDKAGKLLLMGGRDGRVFLYDIPSKVVDQLESDLRDEVTFVGFAAEDDRYVAVTAEGQIRVWDLIRAQAFTLGPAAARKAFKHVVLRPDAKAVLLYCPANHCHWWPLEPDGVSIALPESVTAAGFLKNQVITVDTERNVQVWLETPTLSNLFAPAPNPDRISLGPVYSMASVTNKDGDSVILGDENGTVVRVFGPPTQAMRPLPSHEKKRIWRIEATPGGDILVGMDNGDAIVFSLQYSDCHILREHPTPVTHLRMNSRSLAALTSAPDEGRSRLWKLETPNGCTVRCVAPYSLERLWSSPDGRWLIVQLRNERPKTYRFALYDTSRKHWQIVTEESSWQQFVALQVENGKFDPATAKLLTLSNHGTIESWTLSGNRERISIFQWPNHDRTQAYAICDTGAVRLALFLENGTLVVRHIEDGSMRYERRDHAIVAPFCAAFSPDGGQLALGANDGRIFIWNLLQPGTKWSQIGHHQHRILHLTWSTDGKYLASSSDDKTAGVWIIDETNAMPLFFEHPLPVIRAAFSADGQRLATSSEDTFVRVFSRTDRSYQVTIRGHDLDVTALLFETNDLLWTASVDGTLRRWPLNADSLYKKLEQASPMELPPHIAQRYTGETLREETKYT